MLVDHTEKISLRLLELASRVLHPMGPKKKLNNNNF
jgi:hypothetical protein